MVSLSIEEVSSERTKIISSTINLVLNENLSWEMLASMLDEMSSNLSNSKQIITILLQELKTLYEKRQISHNEKVTFDHRNKYDTNETDIEEDKIDEVVDDNLLKIIQNFLY